MKKWEYMTQSDAGRIIGVSRQAVRKMVDRGSLPSAELYGGAIVLPTRAVYEFRDSRRIAVQKEMRREENVK